MGFDSKEVREREAWYKAGSSAMLSYAIIAVVIVDVIAGALAVWFNAGRYQTIVITMLASLAGLAVVHQWIDIQARSAVRKAEVQVDHF